MQDVSMFAGTLHGNCCGAQAAALHGSCCGAQAAALHGNGCGAQAAAFVVLLCQTVQLLCSKRISEIPGATAAMSQSAHRSYVSNNKFKAAELSQKSKQ
jgi:hypothetical protein